MTASTVPFRSLLILLLFVLLTTTTKEVEAVLAGAIVIPHGDFAYDPTLIPWNNTTRNALERQNAEKIAAAARRAGNFLVHDIQPELIFLSTPHGVKLDNDFAIFMGNRGQGTVTVGGDLYNASQDDLYNFTMEVDLSPKFSKQILSHLKYDATNRQQRNNVSGIYNYNDEEPILLQWGEIIPLSMMLPPKLHQEKPWFWKWKTPTLIWSHPERRYTDATLMVPELLRLGHQIRTFVENRPERIGVVISADLSHTHEPQGPYGYSNVSGPFDAAIADWASDPCSVGGAISLLEKGRSMQDQAKSCGFTGLVLLHGMLCNWSRLGHETSTDHLSSIPYNSSRVTLTSAREFEEPRFRSTMLANTNVTYYGMMAATFARIDDKSQQ